MKTRLTIENNKLSFLCKSKLYTFDLKEDITLEKRANDYVFHGPIRVCDYDHRTHIESNEKIIDSLKIDRSFLTKDLITVINNSQVTLKKDPIIKNLSILYIPLFILVFIFIVLNIFL